jgi:hypothetical protein
MVPMTFVCVIAAAVWHYAAGGVSGWFWSLLVLAGAFPLLTRQNLSVRIYRFAE